MRSLYFRHALSNTMVPVITIIGLQFGGVIAFSIVTESVFQWPGMGLLFLESIRFVDIPVMAAYLMLISVMFVGINLIVDILYFFIDPRLRSDIFQKFKQLGDVLTDKPPGLGLGLHMARVIVEQHGGRIWYEPADDGGSVFDFALPLAPAFVADPADA